MRNPQTNLHALWGVVTVAWLIGWATEPVRSFDPVEPSATFAVLATSPATRQVPKPSSPVQTQPLPSRAAGGSALAAKWHKTKATFYGDPYDDGKRRKCADDKTVYKSDGEFCAIWTGGSGKVVPLGSVIEVRRGKVTLTLKVTDRQKYRSNRLIDLPTKTWDRLGAKRSTGVVAVEWRRVK